MSPSSFRDLLGVVREPPQLPDIEGIPDLIEVARVHRVSGLAARRLLDLGRDRLPEQIRRSLQAELELHKARGALILALAGQIAQLFLERSIPCLFIKGPGLLGLVYTSLPERTMSDLDILVPGRHFAESCEVLARNGFREAPAPRPRDYFLLHHFHMPWKAPNGIAVELHWDLVRPWDPFRPDLDAIFARSSRATGTGMTTPSAADAVLLQSLQHHQEGFSCLGRSVDIDRLARVLRERDWETLVSHATAAGAGPLVAAGLESSRRLLGSPVPDNAMLRLLPPGFAASGLRSLRLDRMIERRQAEAWPSLRWLVRFWTCPNGRARFAAFRQCLGLEPGFWEDTFFVSRGEVPLARRTKVRAGRSAAVAWLALYQAWLFVERDRPS